MYKHTTKKKTLKEMLEIELKIITRFVFDAMEVETQQRNKYNPNIFWPILQYYRLNEKYVEYPGTLVSQYAQNIYAQHIVAAPKQKTYKKSSIKNDKCCVIL